MRTFLAKLYSLIITLNWLVLLASPFLISRLAESRYNPLNYMPGWLYITILYLWGSATLYFRMSTIPFFKSPRRRVITIASFMSFALVSGLLVIWYVG